MTLLSQLKVRIFADGADRQGMLESAKDPLIKGFTTNPSLMRKAGVADYRAFAKDIVQAIPDRPISFEVFADGEAEMERQAMEIAGWGKHVYVKIPVTNTESRPMGGLIDKLSRRGVKLNVTALLTTGQVRDVAGWLKESPGAFVSVFAGRIADTGMDPIPLMKECMAILEPVPKAELLWASAREVLNVWHAEEAGCPIITLPNDIVKKLGLAGKNLTEYSLDTVKMFFEDAKKAGFKL